MTRPKGTPNKKVETKPIAKVLDNNVSWVGKTDIVFIDPELQESKSDQSVKEVFMLIVDALYDKDGDAATWRPIREKIEAL